MPSHEPELLDPKETGAQGMIPSLMEFCRAMELNLAKEYHIAGWSATDYVNFRQQWLVGQGTERRWSPMAAITLKHMIESIANEVWC